MERSEEVGFQLAKMQKMNTSWNIKFKYITYVFLGVGSPNMKVYTCH